MVQEPFPAGLFSRVGGGRGDQLAQVLCGLLFGLILQGKQGEPGERKAVKRLQEEIAESGAVPQMETNILLHSADRVLGKRPRNE